MRARGMGAAFGGFVAGCACTALILRDHRGRDHTPARALAECSRPASTALNEMLGITPDVDRDIMQTLLRHDATLRKGRLGRHAPPLAKHAASKSVLQDAFVRLHQLMYHVRLLPLSNWGERRAYPPRRAPKAGLLGAAYRTGHGREHVGPETLGRLAVNAFLLQQSPRVVSGARCLSWDTTEYALLVPGCSADLAWAFEFRVGEARVNHSSRVVAANLAAFGSGGGSASLDSNSSLGSSSLGSVLSSFDLVVCMQVLEHVPRPAEAVRAIHRLLRPGGLVFLSAPFTEKFHMIPHSYGDFFRFTAEGARALFEGGGLEVLVAQKWGDAAISSGYLMGFGAADFPLDQLERSLLQNASTTGRIETGSATTAWSEEAKALLQEAATDAKSACEALRAASSRKDDKLAALAGVRDLAAWAEAEGVFWTEPYLVTLLPSVMSLCADKERPVQLAADTTGAALMAAINPLAVDGMIPLLFGAFDEHRWQTKLSAVTMFAALARSSPKTVSASLPRIVVKLMEVSQDPKVAIKEAATVALKECCAVIANPDVTPLIDDVIAANMEPEQNEACLDKLVATTYVTAVDEPTLSIIVPVLMRALRTRGNVGLVRKAAVVVHTMFRLVNNPADVAAFAPDLLTELARNAEEVATPEARAKIGEALNTVRVTLGEYEATRLDCSASEIEEVLLSSIERAAADGASELAPAARGDEVSSWVAQLTAPLVASGRPRCVEMVSPYLVPSLGAPGAGAAAAAFLKAVELRFGGEAEEEAAADHDDLAVLCDCSFSLAYGNRVLLHNTRLKLKRGKCYGLIGPNGAGKSTLMRSIAADAVEGFPKQIRSVYVECDVSPSHADASCVDFVRLDQSLSAKDGAEVAAMLTSVGFSEQLMWGPVGALSGGWRMRLALSRAMLQQPELLLLDEPTNHVDAQGVAWLTKYVQDLASKEVSSMIVSHDSVFLDNVAQDMVHYEKNRKLKVYPGNLSEFVKAVPEAAAYYKLSSDSIAFTFPAPGSLDGVTSKTKALVKLTDVHFKYPGREANVLAAVSVQVSLASRVACIGANGAGKSTLIKLLVGELSPNEGEGKGKVEKHPNMRMAYVAQHAFHHIESHLDRTPAEYIEWRFSGGMDAEGQALNFITLAPDEAKLVGQKAGQVDKLVRRRKGKKGFEYEVQMVGCEDPLHENEWVAQQALLELTWTDPEDKKKRALPCGGALAKLMQITDERVAFETSGISEKKLSVAEVQAHLSMFNLEEQFGTFAKISALSGGQKVKVVLAAAMWVEPHVLILDEPTNFLDRDSLGALATAIKGFGGGCIIISHQREFYSALCTETWEVAAGRCTVSGSDWMEGFLKARAKELKEEEAAAAAAAAAKEGGAGKPPVAAKGKAAKAAAKVYPEHIPKAELKKIKKKVDEMRKKGDTEVTTEDELERAGYELSVK